MLRRVVALTFGATILLSTAITSFAAASPQSIVRSLAIQAHKQIAKEFPGSHLPIKVSCDRHTGKPGREPDRMLCVHHRRQVPGHLGLHLYNVKATSRYHQLHLQASSPLNAS